MDLFGKKKLEDRIQELEVELSRLESEREQLQHTLEKREERIKKLSAANQEANVALKAAEQRAATIASSFPPAQSGGEPREEKKPEGRNLGWRDAERLLERLDAQRSHRDDLLTAYYPGSSPEDPSLPEPLRKAASAVSSPRGGIILHTPQLFSLLLIPPFPNQESRTTEGSAFFLEPIRELSGTGVVIISVHAGDTFLGVSLSVKGFEWEEVIQSQVMGRHSKGGWSQKRFERLRDEDIKGHIDQVEEKLEALLTRFKPLLSCAVVSGEEALLRQVASTIDLPLVERNLPRHGPKGSNNLLLNEAYGFVCYRIDT